MQEHGQEEKELDAQDLVIAWAKGKAGGDAAEDEVEDSRDEQEVDGDPG